jgi:ribosomal protein S18 acetylase RimI-like enzyme
MSDKTKTDKLKILSLNDYNTSDRVVVINTLTDINQDVERSFFSTYVNSPYSECFVIEKGDEIYGYVCVEFFDDSFNIDDIIIDSDCRKKGYGKMLIDFLVEKYMVDEDGDYFAHAISLECNNKNKDALIFYTRYGFVVVGFISDYYKTGESAVCMKYRREV